MIRNVTFENYLNKLFIPLLLQLLIAGIVSRAFPSIDFLYYIVPPVLIINIFFVLFFKLYSEVKPGTLILIFAFPLYALITSLWSLYPIITIQRSGFLLLMYAGILAAVLLLNKNYTSDNLKFLIPANVFIIIISAAALIINSQSENWSGGNGLGFMGFAGHQNTLAAALLFTLPGTLALVNSDQRLVISKVNWNRIFFWLLFTANCLLITLSYSRAALLSLAIGIITYLLITKSKKILAYTITTAALFTVLYFAVPSFQIAVNGFINKDGGRILDRRMILWNPSFEAAEQGGIFGLGYGVSAPEIKTPLSTGSHYEDGRYIREKGNSTLAIVEETGLIGLMLFLLPIFYFIINTFNSPNTILTPHSSLLTATLSAMLVHSQFEAWWVGVGSVSLPLYLIILFMLIIKVQKNDVISSVSEKS